VYFDGCNVNIRSGSGATDGTLNGLGNLVVGYNEKVCQLSDDACTADGDCPANTCTSGFCSVNFTGCRASRGLGP
jgi:hypothetical protein